MEEFNIKELSKEINALSSIANFGSIRLKESNNRLMALQSELNTLSNQDGILSYINNLRQFQGVIKASQEAVFDWKVKVENYFKQVHAYAGHPHCQNRAELMTLSTTMTELMKIFSSQLSLLQQQSDKHNQLMTVAKRKKKSFVTSFERGKAPILGVDEDDWATAEV